MKNKNNISIQHFLTEPLIVLPEQDFSEKEAIGGNRKKILVLYKDDKNQTEILDFLKKILAAVQLDIDKDILLLKSKKGTLYSFIGMRTKLEFKQMLVFGLKANQLGLNIQTDLYRSLFFEDCQFLFVDELSAIAKDQKLKAALWNCLKEMFSNKE